MLVLVLIGSGSDGRQKIAPVVYIYPSHGWKITPSDFINAAARTWDSKHFPSPC